MRAALFVALAGCAATAPTPAQQLTVSAYAAELQACVDKSATRQLADACKADVDARYPRPSK